MTIVVEDGTGLAGANSYASEDDFDTYCEDRNYTVTVGDTEAALIRGTQILDSIYAQYYPGSKTYGRSQGLQWPRIDALDIDGFEIGAGEIPIEIIDATCEIALRELAAPNSTLPDLERGGAIRSIRAGTVAIDYGDNASTTTTLQLVNGILSPLIGGSARGGTVMSGIATRG